MSLQTPTKSAFIPLAIPEIRSNEWKYLKECLDAGWVSSAGPFVKRFEEEFADYMGAANAVATVNGTAALHIALLVAGVRPDDEVLVSDLTFIAPVNAIRYAGAWPVLIDVEKDSWQMDVGRARAFLEQKCSVLNGETRSRETGRRVKAVVPVHILGNCVDMDPLLELAREFHLMVIEDATEGLGSRYKDRPLGTMGHLGCFSFNGNKIITTGGGGMLVSRSDELSERARYLSTQAKDDEVEFVHGAIGYNYRLTNLQAAMGCAQLEVLEEYVRAKRQIAARYTECFEAVKGISPMREAEASYSSFWLYTILVDESEARADSRTLASILRQNGIETRPLWQPMHRSAPHRGCEPWDCPIADILNRRSISLPCSVGLAADDQDRVISTILRYA